MQCIFYAQKLLVLCRNPILYTQHEEVVEVSINHKYARRIMDSNLLFSTILNRAENTFKRSLDGLTESELIAQPGGDRSNPIAWLAMHLIRVQDGLLSRVQGKKTEWSEGEWFLKFGLNDEDVQWTPDNVHTFTGASVDLLLNYWGAVKSRTDDFIANLNAEDLDKEFPPMRPGGDPMTLAQILAIVLGDNIQHIGQIAYLRGVIKEHGWY